MKTLLKALALCLTLALTATVVFASEDEEREYGRGARYESKFYGTVEKLPEGIDGTWIVNGKEMLVRRDTIIKEKHGKVAVGAYVEVEGNLSGKTFTAYKIEVKRAVSEQPVGVEIKVAGRVERIPEGILGTWIVNGKEVFVTKHTVVKEELGKAEIGAYVEINGRQTGKTFHAYWIEVRKDKN